MSQAMRIVAQKLDEIAQIADALDTTAAHLTKAQARQQRLIEKQRRQAAKRRRRRRSS